MKYKNVYLVTIAIETDDEIIGAKEQVAMALEHLGYCAVLDVKKAGKIKVADKK